MRKYTEVIATAANKIVRSVLDDLLIINSAASVIIKKQEII
jgi:hypothetical protein